MKENIDKIILKQNIFIYILFRLVEWNDTLSKYLAENEDYSVKQIITKEFVCEEDFVIKFDLELKGEKYCEQI